MCRPLVVDEPGGGVSLNRRALHALLKAWPQSSRPLGPRAAAGSDAGDFGRFGQAPDARHYLHVRRAPYATLGSKGLLWISAWPAGGTCTLGRRQDAPHYVLVWRVPRAHCLAPWYRRWGACYESVNVIDLSAMPLQL